MRLKQKDNLYFLGGLNAAIGSNLGATQGLSQAAGVGGMVSGVLPEGSKGAGALSGAAQGAQMGAVAGPWGMAAGAVLGGAKGLIDAGNAQKEARRQEFISDIQKRNEMMGINSFADGGKKDSQYINLPQLLLNKRIYNTVDAKGGHSDNLDEIKKQVGNILRGKNERVDKSSADQELFGYSLGQVPLDEMTKWEKSTFSPSNAKDKDQLYIRPTNYNREALLSFNQHLDALNKDSDVVGGAIVGGGFDPMGNYTVSRGKDDKGKYISMYDKWDFANPVANYMLRRKPEIYDRVYYRDNPEYGKPNPLIPQLEDLIAKRDSARQLSETYKFPIPEKDILKFKEARKGYLDFDKQVRDLEEEINATPRQPKYIEDKQALLSLAIPERRTPWVPGNKTFDNGGNLNKNNMLTEFNNGGSHELNPLGGIPQGISPDGTPNKVEEGETKWEDYIFSNRLMLDKNTASNHNLDKKHIGKSFADISKELSKQYKERPNDPISRDTVRANMGMLQHANDEVRNIKEAKEAKKAINDFAKGGYMNIPMGVPNNMQNDYANGDFLDLYNPATMQGLETKSLLETPTDPRLTFNKGTGYESMYEDLLPTTADFTSDLSNTPEKSPIGFNSEALRYAPIAFNALAGTGLFGKAPEAESYEPTMIQRPGRLKAQQLNMEAPRAAVDQAYQTGISSLAGATGGSGAAMRAGLTGLHSGYVKGLGDTYLKAQERNLINQQTTDQFNIQTGQQTEAANVQAMNRAKYLNAMNKTGADRYAHDTRMGYLGAAAEGLGDVGYEERMRDILPRIFGYDDRGVYSKARGGKLYK